MSLEISCSCIICGIEFPTEKALILSLDLVEALCRRLELEHNENWDTRLLNCTVCSRCYRQTATLQELCTKVTELEQEITSICTEIRKSVYVESYESYSTLRTDLTFALQNLESRKHSEANTVEEFFISNDYEEEFVLNHDKSQRCDRDEILSHHEAITSFDNGCNIEDISISELERLNCNAKKQNTQRSNPVNLNSFKRNKFFSADEIKVLMDEVQRRSVAIQSSSLLDKQKEWNEISHIVSKVSGIPRSAEQCRCKVKNIRNQKRQSCRKHKKQSSYSKTEEKKFLKRKGKDYFPNTYSITSENTTVLENASSETHLAVKNTGEGDSTLCTENEEFVLTELQYDNTQSCDCDEILSDHEAIASFDNGCNIVDISISESEILKSIPREQLKQRSNMLNVNSIRRNNNFSADENKVLMDELQRRKIAIQNSSLLDKRNQWNEIAQIVSKVSGIPRSAEQCRQREKNIEKQKRQPYRKHKKQSSYSKTDDRKLRKRESKHYFPNTCCDSSGNTIFLKNVKLELKRCDESLVFPRKQLVKSTTRLQQLKARISRRRKQIYEKSKKASSTSMRNIKIKCLKCPNRFPTEDSMKRHMNRSHRPRPETYHCPIAGCEEQYNSIKFMEAHIRYNHPNQEFLSVCGVDNCELGFYTDAGLQSHKQNIHYAEKKFECNTCGKKFLKNEQLKLHTFTVHSDKPNFICEICSKTFRRKQNLQSHQGKYHGDVNPELFKPDLQTCPICGFKSHSRDYARRHLKTHGDKSLFKYVCQEPNCNYRGYTPSQLRRHSETHSEPQYACHLCPKLLKSKYRLNYHLERHDGALKYDCAHCQRKFANAKSLKNHITVIHENKPNIVCEDCGAGFPIRKYYNRHRLICAEGYSGTSKKSSEVHVEARRKRENYYRSEDKLVNS